MMIPFNLYKLAFLYNLAFFSVAFHPKSFPVRNKVFEQNFPECSFSTTTTSSSTITNTPMQSSMIASNCIKLCSCRNITTYNVTELMKIVEETVRTLTINKRVTSKYKRQITSADDTRPSAHVLGAVGVAMLVLVFGGIILLDLPTLVIVYRTACIIKK